MSGTNPIADRPEIDASTHGGHRGVCLMRRPFDFESARQSAGTNYGQLFNLNKAATPGTPPMIHLIAVIMLQVGLESSYSAIFWLFNRPL